MYVYACVFSKQKMVIFTLTTGRNKEFTNSSYPYKIYNKQMQYNKNRVE